MAQHCGEARANRAVSRYSTFCFCFCLGRLSAYAIAAIVAPAAVVVIVLPPGPPMTVARSDCASLGNPAVKVQMKMEAFATAAGVDLEVRRPRIEEANAVIAALLQLVAHLVGVMC